MKIRPCLYLEVKADVWQKNIRIRGHPGCRRIMMTNSLAP